eukprot:CAMPEP_0170530026 /NCGR_PEP_ID=MMETSP0209-20121228/39320_1 /TAXON_ID=665100 ORGANISM="Litonotus pictus, Strain P1" /NCGR_SAMPLE_ID=MMETSP0209 /ASSEMBLY_ACC=CAM_ASM_000301 /LENGTH=89 /DNA_ID=CAMNT_0010822695 /DNA_START=27 /DNA_END=292 /DNA_ORIENTATION=-
MLTGKTQHVLALSNSDLGINYKSEAVPNLVLESFLGWKEVVEKDEEDLLRAFGRLKNSGISITVTHSVWVLKVNLYYEGEEFKNIEYFL